MAVSEEQLIDVVMGLARFQRSLVQAIGMKQNNSNFAADLVQHLPKLPENPTLADATAHLGLLSLISPTMLADRGPDLMKEHL